MNKLRLLLTWGLLLAVSHVMGINITVDPVEIEPGATAQLVINLNNTENDLTAYQMSLYLPEGVTVKKKANGKYDFKANADRHDGEFTVSVKDAADGSVLIACFSADKDVLVGNSGELIRLSLEVASTVTTSLQGSLKNMEFTDVSTTAYHPADVTFDLNLKGGSVTPTGNVTVSAADLNVTAGDAASLSINMATDVPNLTAYQMSLYLPEGVTVKKKANGKYDFKANADRHDGEFTVSVKDAADGSVLIACFSADKDVLVGTDGELIRLSLEVTSTVTTSLQGSLKNMEFTDVSTTAYHPADATFNIAVTVPVQPVTITADNLTMVYGDDVPTLTYKSEGAELNGTPKLSTTATKTSPVGTYPITVEKGTVTNEQVTYVAGTLTITKAPLTIAAETYTKKQGEAMPEFTLTYTGFKNNETKDVLTKQPVVSCTANEASAPGEYPVTVSGAEAKNYAISYTNGKLVVAAADAVIIKAKNCSREYGDANPTFEYTVEGATLDGVPEISCEATATSPVGTYDIIVKKGSVKNYNVTYVAGTLTVTKAQLTIAAGTYTKKQGEAMPEFTLTYTGFKNNETKDVLTKQPVVSCTANEASAPGEYPVTVSGAEAKNYAISYTDGKLVVTAADGDVLVVVPAGVEQQDWYMEGIYYTQNSSEEVVPSVVTKDTKVAINGNDIYVQGLATWFPDAWMKGEINGTTAIFKSGQFVGTDEYGKEYMIGSADGKTISDIEFGFDTEAQKLTLKTFLIENGDSRDEFLLYGYYEPDGLTITNKATMATYEPVKVPAGLVSEQWNLHAYDMNEAEVELPVAVGIDGNNIYVQGLCKYLPKAWVKGTLNGTTATFAAGQYYGKYAIYEMFFGGYNPNGDTMKDVVFSYDAEAGRMVTNDIILLNSNVDKMSFYDYMYQTVITKEVAVSTVVRADDKTIVYGEELPELTYHVEGEELNGTPKLSTTATSASPVGTYPIKVERGTVTNQGVSYVDGTLTILQNTKDLTSRVGTTAQDWNGTGMVGQYAPTIITRDGRKTAMAERYTEHANVTGNVLSQTVNGLENGEYKVTLYANARFTPGRGFSSNITEGQQNVVYVYANDTKQFVPAYRDVAVSVNGEYTLMTNVTNGTLRLGMYAEKIGTNWQTIQIKSLDRIGDVNGISELMVERSNAKRIYSLSGQRVDASYRGVVIQDGKKHVVK